MSISKVIILNFSDGTNTVYTRQSTLYIPFEVDNFKVVNTYSTFEGGGATPESYSITSDLVQGNQNFLTLGRYFTSCNPTEHIYNIPRPINGTYNFTANFSNTLLPFYTAGHTRNVVVGDNGNAVVAWIELDVELIPTVVWPPFYYDYGQIGNSLGMNPLDKFYNADGSTFNAPNEVRIIGYDAGNDRHILNIAVAIPVATNLYYGYTDKIHLDPQAGQNPYYGQAPDPRAINNSGSTFVEYPNNYIVSAYPVSGIPYYKMNQPAIIGTMLPAVAGSGGRNQLLTYKIPQVFKFNDLTSAEIALDIEFYEKFKLYENLKIQNYQYVFWQIESLADATKYIDIPFPVDEIEITNADMMNDAEYPIYGYFSNLVNSSTTDQDLINKNYTNGIFFNSYTTSHYQTNKKKFLFSNPRFFSGQYNVYSRYLIDNTINDITSTESIYFQIKFVQYRKEIGDRTK